MRALLIYNVHDIRLVLTRALTAILVKHCAVGGNCATDRYGNNLEALITYWFLSRLEDICLVYPPSRTYLDIPPEIRRELNALPAELETWLYWRIQVPQEFHGRVANVTLDTFDLYLYYV